MIILGGILANSLSLASAAGWCLRRAHLRRRVLGIGVERFGLIGAANGALSVVGIALFPASLPPTGPVSVIDSSVTADNWVTVDFRVHGKKRDQR